MGENYDLTSLMMNSEASFIEERYKNICFQTNYLSIIEDNNGFFSTSKNTHLSNYSVHHFALPRAKREITVVI